MGYQIILPEIVKSLVWLILPLMYQVLFLEQCKKISIEAFCIAGKIYN